MTGKISCSYMNRFFEPKNTFDQFIVLLLTFIILCFRYDLDLPIILDFEIWKASHMLFQNIPYDDDTDDANNEIEDEIWDDLWDSNGRQTTSS